jgi:putative membrane protein
MKTQASSETRVAAIVWLSIGAWAAVTLTSLFAPEIVSFNLSRYLTLVLMIAFTLMHGSQRYGWGGALTYLILAVVITNLFENLSIVTGFPFSEYHHTASMGPKVFHVPVIVGPIFAVAGYLGWVLAGILLGDAFTARKSGLMIARPVIAAFITTSWDLCVDPIGGTINRDWVWADGGGYFGVPWANFFGWMLTMWAIFQAFAVFLAWRAKPAVAVRARAYWLQPVVFWTLIALQFPLLFVVVPDATVSDAAGTVWQVSHLLEAMALVSFFTMLFVAVLSACLLYRSQRPTDF